MYKNNSSSAKLTISYLNKHPKLFLAANRGAQLQHLLETDFIKFSLTSLRINIAQNLSHLILGFLLSKQYKQCIAFEVWVIKPKKIKYHQFIRCRFEGEDMG